MSQKRLQSRAPGARQCQRLDKWLWYARIVKSRTLAAAVVGSGKVRVNRERVAKPSHVVKPGDVVTATVAKNVRVLKVLEVGYRRGPAAEAQGLYEDLTPAANARTSLAPHGPSDELMDRRLRVFGREPGAGRPTKRDRRLIVRLKGRHDDR